MAQRYSADAYLQRKRRLPTPLLRGRLQSCMFGVHKNAVSVPSLPDRTVPSQAGLTEAWVSPKGV